ncbi:HSP90 family protein [Arcanobacterium haemolyticum]|nr:HSP90 family protein [Arcanobacterium haemolyticum]
MADRFQVDLAGMVDLLSRHLYSGPQVYIRELLQNAVDAMTARKELSPDAPQRVRLVTSTDEDGKPTLTISDTGIGLTSAEARELLATIGRSSKRDPLLGEGRAEFIGQFGIGMLATFMVADEIEVVSRSAREPGVPAIRWVGHADGTFSLEEFPPENIEIGSRVRLKARRDCEHWLSNKTVAQLAQEYGALLPYDVAINVEVDGEEKWRRLTREELPWEDGQRDLSGYCESLFGWKPLGAIPLHVPLAGLSGMAFILPQAVAPGTGQHRVYSKRMLLGTRIDKILPEWAFFVRGVINSDAVTPTASREDIHDDEFLWEIREALGSQLKQWLYEALSSQGKFAHDFIRTHHLALRAVALTDPTMLDLVARILPYETTNGVLTLEEAREEGTLVYTSTTEDFRRISSVARAQGLSVVNAGYVYDADIVTSLGKSGWSIRELEAKDVVQILGLPPASRLAEVSGAVAHADELLEKVDCEVLVREFAPDDLPALILKDADAQRRRALHNESVQAPDLWGGLLASLDTEVPKRSRTLVLNDNSAVVRQLLAAQSSDIFDSALSSLYLSAVMLAGEGLGGAEARALGVSLSDLLAAALRGGE